MKLSIVIPVYNEEKTLRELVGRVQATPHEKELILVNDCSRDSTAEIMKELEAEYDNLRCYHHEVNRGKGGALATGFQKVEGDVVIIQDADLEYDPNDYVSLLRPIEDGVADVEVAGDEPGGDEQIDV